MYKNIYVYVYVYKYMYSLYTMCFMSTAKQKTMKTIYVKKTTYTSIFECTQLYIFVKKTYFT